MPVFKINFLLIFFWAFLTYFLPLSQRKKNLVFLGIVFIQFTLIAWQRDFYVGQDTYGYFLAYQRMASTSFIQLQKVGWEPGYNICNWIISQIGGNFHTYLLASAIFIYYSFLRFVYKYSPCVWLSVLIFISFGYFQGSLHILRQYMAVAIILFSYQYLLERRLLPFIIFVIIASLFHASAITFIATYFVWQKIPSKSSHLVLLFLASVFIALILGKYILSIFLFNDKFSERYLNDDSAGTGYSMLILMSLIMFFGILLRPKIISKKILMFYNIYFIALCLQPLATLISMVSRGILYWSISITVFLPIIISKIKDKTLRLIAYSFVIIGLFIFFLKITNSHEGVEQWATYRLYNGE